MNFLWVVFIVSSLFEIAFFGSSSPNLRYGRNIAIAIYLTGFCWFGSGIALLAQAHEPAWWVLILVGFGAATVILNTCRPIGNHLAQNKK